MDKNPIRMYVLGEGSWWDDGKEGGGSVDYSYPSTTLGQEAAGNECGEPIWFVGALDEHCKMKSLESKQLLDDIV